MPLNLEILKKKHSSGEFDAFLCVTSVDRLIGIIKIILRNNYNSRVYKASWKEFSLDLLKQYNMVVFIY